MDVRVGLRRRLSAEELMLLNCGVGKDSWESLGLQGDPTSPFWRRSALGFLWKEWCWSWNSSTLATSFEELTHWKRLWCWEGLGAGGEGDDRGWGGWMASLTRWTWVWVNLGSLWWTGRPGVLRFMGSQRVGATELTDWLTRLWNASLATDQLSLSVRYLRKDHTLRWQQDINSVFLAGGCVLSRFSRVRLFVTLWTVAPQAPLSLGFSRQEYWSGLPCPFLGNLPKQGSNRHLLPVLQTDRFFTTSATWEAHY